MIINFVRNWWCYFMHQRRGHAVIFNVTENTWKCITCKRIIEKN